MLFLLNRIGLVLLAVHLMVACKQETVLVNVTAPAEELRVSPAALEQYIFRCYVDLIGAAPNEDEVAEWSQVLRAANYNVDSRLQLLQALQTSDRYRAAYAFNLYQSAKERFIENLDDAELERRFGSLGTPEENLRVRQLLDWPRGVLLDTTDYLALQRLCVFNGAYDVVNMGSFNFVRATFDNLLWRFPTDQEYAAGFAMVDEEQSRMLFDQMGQSKADYVRIITQSEEALEGTIIWQYEQLLARRPSASETLAAVPALRDSKQVIELQQAIMQSDEYAGF